MSSTAKRVSALMPLGRQGNRYVVLLVGTSVLAMTPVRATASSQPHGFADRTPSFPVIAASIPSDDRLSSIDAGQPDQLPSSDAPVGLPLSGQGIPSVVTASSPWQTAPIAPAGPPAQLASRTAVGVNPQLALEQERVLTKTVSYAPNVTDPDKLLALYQDGAGQTQTSMDELDLVLGNRQVFEDLRTLETRLDGMRRPVASVVNRHSTQSDHLIINELEVSQDLYFSEGRDSVRLAVFKTDYSLRDQLGINEYTGGFTSNVRLNDVAAIAGDLWVNGISYGRQSTTLATYDAYLTLRPSDTIRIDIDANRRTFDNITSLRLGITARTYSGSIDFLPTDELRLTARVFAGLYSDRNRRRAEEIEAIWRIRTNPVVEIGLKGTNFDFTRLLNNGYFNPKEYYSGEALARVQWDVTPKLSTELAGSAGAEDAHPGGVKPLVKGSLQVIYKLVNGWSVDGEVAHFTSRSSTSSGFSRTSFTAGLHYRF